jgi:chemotaxis protein methyltransferase CheR
VHETYFFRERPQLQAFIADVVPELRALRRTDPVLRAWSAGTSTGEEAYTLSILLHEAGVRQHEVLGTDLAVDAIEQAQAGKFTPRSFRGEIDADVRRRWFIYELGGVRVTPELKTTTRFSVVNLLDESAVDKLPQFDVIFCRNVLIYMAGPARQRVIDLFYRRLRPGGVLFLGHSESLLHVDTAFSLRPLSHGLAYAKPELGGK